MNDVTESIDAFRKMLEDYYTKGTSISFYVPYIPLQWIHYENTEKTDESNDNG